MEVATSIVFALGAAIWCKKRKAELGDGDRHFWADF